MEKTPVDKLRPIKIYVKILMLDKYDLISDNFCLFISEVFLSKLLNKI